VPATLGSVVAVVALVATAGLAGCSSGGGGSGGAAPSSTTAASSRPAADCGATVDAPPELPEPLADALAELTAETGLGPAPAHERFRLVCDRLGATAALVPAAWTDERPGPEDPPQPGVTVGPDLDARVEVAPVVGIGAARFVGDPPTAAFVNEQNAAGSLENGTRTPPRVGDSIADGCDPLDPVPFRVGGFTGEIQPYEGCDGEARAWLVATGFPDEGDQYQTLLIGQALTTGDLDALVRALATLTVDPDHVPARELPPLPVLDGP
jgi:hypothetical protein